MSYGDEIMASGQAKKRFEQTGRRIQICTTAGQPRWSSMWLNLPYIAQPQERGHFDKIRNAPGCRPYIVYPWRGGGHKYTDWQAAEHVGEIIFSQEELDFAGEVVKTFGHEFVIIEPNIARNGNKNKQWGFSRWQQLADLSRNDVLWLQMGDASVPRLKNIATVITPDFRKAAAVLSQARTAVLPEGGLHHAAAALHKTVVVLFGGVTSMYNVGYPTHVNVVDRGEGSPCGRWSACPHCERVWRSISPDQVLEVTMQTVAACDPRRLAMIPGYVRNGAQIWPLP